MIPVLCFSKLLFNFKLEGFLFLKVLPGEVSNYLSLEQLLIRGQPSHKDVAFMP
jgi:hypothetical protein